MSAVERLGSIRAARLLALLWMFTSLAFFLHPQTAWPFFSPFAAGDKLPTVALSLASCLFVLLWPENFFCLVAAAFAGLISVLAWHSWLGAYQPLVPVCFFFLAFTTRVECSERRRLIVDSLLLALLAGGVHCLNSSYLNGFEFSPAGTLFRDIPLLLRAPAEGFPSAAFCARLWLAAWLLPLPFLARGGRTGWLLFAGIGAATVVLYKVVFYALFLCVPAVLLFDPEFLNRWRWNSEAKSRSFPLGVFLSGQALFFLWYLLFRNSTAVFGIAVFLCLAALFGSVFRPSALPALFSRRSAPGKTWLVLWSLYLAAPLFLSRIPPPFGMTEFSAREKRVVPATPVQNPLGLSECHEVAAILALRWGYRIWPANGGCMLYVYP